MKHIAVVLAALTAGLLPSGALAATKLEVSLFPSAGWVLHIGQAQGLFAKEGLDVHPDPITSSIAQITGMMD